MSKASWYRHKDSVKYMKREISVMKNYNSFCGTRMQESKILVFMMFLHEAIKDHEKDAMEKVHT